MAGFNMDLLMYYLGGIGGEIGGEDWMKKLGGMAQETQKAKSMSGLTQKYQDMFGKALGGEVGEIPPGVKLTMDEEGMTAKFAKPMTGRREEEEKEGPKVIQPPVPTERGGEVSEKNLPGQTQSRILEGFLNPSVSPSGITGADLVGLTTQDISQALSGALNVAKFKQRAPYMGALTAESRVRAAEQTPTYTIPGTPVKMTRKEYVQWYTSAPKDERTAAIKNYEYYAQGVKGKGETPKSFEGFQDSARTSQEKNYDRYASDETAAGRTPKSFNEWYLERTKAGATQLILGDITKKEVAKGAGRAIADVTSPDFPQTIREDLAKDAMAWNMPPKFTDYVARGYSEAEATEMSQRYMVIKEMDARIRQAYKGKEVVRNRDGWYVEGKLEVRMP